MNSFVNWRGGDRIGDLSRRAIWLAAIGAASLACGKSDGGKAGDKQSASTPEPATPTVVETPSPEPAPKPTNAVSDWYRGWLTSPADDAEGLAESDKIGPLPFFFKLPAAGVAGQALLRSGDIELPIAHTWEGARFVIKFPLYRAAIVGKRGADGALKGEWESASKTWGAGTMPFSARPSAGPGSEPLFASGAGQHAEKLAVAGVFRLSGEKSGAIKLTVTGDPRRAGELVAMYEGAGGNTSRMAGTADPSGRVMRLISFEGNGTYLLTAEVTDGQFSGTWRALHGANVWAEKLTGERVEGGFELERVVTVADRDSAFEIGAADLARYRGKPTIVELAGSWCTNCAYAAPFLVRMHAKYRAQGLEIVSLLYEMTDDDRYNQEQAKIFAREHRIPWQVIAMSGDPSTIAENLPEALDNIDLSGLPIAMFVNKRGQLVHFHSGFPAASSEQYKAVTAAYESWIKEILQ